MDDNGRSGKGAKTTPSPWMVASAFIVFAACHPQVTPLPTRSYSDQVGDQEGLRMHLAEGKWILGRGLG